MSKRILVTGTNGLLGQKLVHLLRQDSTVELIATSRGPNRITETSGYTYLDLDITDHFAIEKAFSEQQPEVVINTAAMTQVDACETERDACRSLNVEAVRYLADACLAANAHLIHLSTDFVFDGEAGPYREEDKPNPLSFYGQSKLDAEQVIQDSGLERWSVLRTIIVYGVAEAMSRSNIVLWAKGALEKGDPLRIVDDQFRAPTLAEDLAIACRDAAFSEANGVFHVSGKDHMSIIELVQRVAAFFELDAASVTPIKSASLSQAAKRPPVTGFVLDKARAHLNYEPHSFEEGLAIVASQLG